MTPIYSSSALKTHQREVKDAAMREVVHITENGNGAFIFCSEGVFDECLHEAAENAVYEERMAAAIRSGRSDVAAGRVYEGTEAAFQAVDQLRARRG